MKNIPRKTFERKLLTQGYDHIIGVDEVGMGCLAGPVVVCAVAVGPDFYRARHPHLSWLRDSKLLQPHHRERFSKELTQQAGLTWSVKWCSPETIDRLNIYGASRLAMRRAIRKLELRETNKELRVMVLVDGNRNIPGLSLPQQAIVKGDRTVWAIAAASVLAKVYRDAMMTRYAKRFPGYGFEIHKGYGTAQHMSRLRELGPCPLHRMSFGAQSAIRS